MKNWFDHILFHTRARPEQPAIVLEDRNITYEMLGTGIERCARRIASLITARDEPVAVLVQSPLRHIILCLALFRTGIPSLSLEHAQGGLKDMKFAAVLGDTAARGVVGPSNRVIEVTDEWFGTDIGAEELPAGFSDAGQVCHISLTSGATGAPKQVAHTVAGIGRRVFEKILGCIDASEHSVLCMPGLSSNYGFTTSCATLVAGRTLCFAESSYQAIRMIETFAIDFALMSTEQLLALTRVARKSGAELRSLRTVWFGGSVPSRALLEAASIYLCKEIYCRYGASEAGLIARASVREMLSEPGLVGDIVPGVEVGVFDASGAGCPPGQAGTIRIRHDEPDAPPTGAAAAASPWIDLGDRGWIDTRGRLFVAGRTSDPDIAVSAGGGGQGVTPVHEIEHLLRLEWDMADAAAVQIEGGDKPQFWIGIVGNEGASAEKLEAIARTRGIDCAIRLVDLKAIPRGLNGKVNRADLKSAIFAVMAPTGKA